MHPITTGKSFISKASIVSLPKPLQLKIYSTKNAPASNEANQPEMAVITGLSALGNACFTRICLADSPLDFCGFYVVFI